MYNTGMIMERKARAMEFPFLERAKWVTDKYILAMLGVFPLFVGLHGYNAITESKYWFFVVVTAVWALAAAVLLIWGLIKGERYRLDVRPAHLAIGVFLAVGGISACLSDWPDAVLLGSNRYDGYLTTMLYCLVFFGVSQLGRPQRRHAWALGISAFVCCAISLLQLMGLDPFHFYPRGTNYYDKYIAYNGAFLGTIGNVGQLAAYLTLPAGFLPAYAALSRHKWDRLLFIPAAMTVAVLALMDLDAGVVAMIGCVLVAVPVVIQRERASRIAGCVSGGVTAAGLVALYFWPGKSGTLYEMSQVLHGRLSDEFGSRRGEIWKQSWQFFKQKPWLGGGPGTTSLRYDILWYSDVRDQTVVVTNAHNVYLGYLVNIGLLGAVPYVTAVACSLVTWLKRRKHGALYPALGAGFLCCLIQDFFGLGLVLTAPMLWVFWGLLETAEEPERLEEPEPASQPEPAEEP